MNDNNNMQKRYDILPEYICLCQDLNPTEKLILAKIFSLSKKTGFCWAGTEYLMKSLKLSKPTMLKYLKNIKSKGFLVEYIDNDRKMKIKYPLINTTSNRFAIIHEDVMQDDELKPADKYLYAIITLFSQNSLGVCWATNEQLNQYMNISEREIRNILKKLNTKKHILIYRNSKYRYIIPNYGVEYTDIERFLTGEIDEFLTKCSETAQAEKFLPTTQKEGGKIFTSNGNIFTHNNINNNIKEIYTFSDEKVSAITNNNVINNEKTKEKDNFNKIRAKFKEYNKDYYHDGKQAKFIKMLLKRCNDDVNIVLDYLDNYVKIKIENKKEFWKSAPLTPQGLYTRLDYLIEMRKKYMSKEDEETIAYINKLFGRDNNG